MSSLSHALQSCDMLLIDGLHAFEFTADTTGLRVECMDGRQLRRWSFTPEQVARRPPWVTSGNWTMPTARIG